MKKPEVWKDIPGYEGLYQISNYGRIKSLEKPYFLDRDVLRKEYFMAPQIKANGYMQISLYKQGVPKTFTVHRLVANAFIPNPDNLPYINHRDENKTNNYATNLEWCNASYNLHYGNAIEKLSKSKMNHPSLSIPVLRLDPNLNLLSEYPSANEAQRQTGIDQMQISNCCNNKKGYLTAGGYKWRYRDDKI